MTPPAFPTFAEALRVWLRIGLLSFGGPAAQIAVMHREVVDQRHWVSRRPVPACAELLHAAAGAGGAATRHLSRLADAWRARRARGRAAVHPAGCRGDAGAVGDLRDARRGADRRRAVLRPEMRRARAGGRGAAARRQARPAWRGALGAGGGGLPRAGLLRRALPAGGAGRARHRLCLPGRLRRRRPWPREGRPAGAARRRHRRRTRPHRPHGAGRAARRAHRHRAVALAGRAAVRRAGLGGHRLVLLEDGGRHLRWRLCGARLCRAGGGGALPTG